MLLIVSMGIPAMNYDSLKEGFRFNGAVIQIIDWEKKTVIKEINYKSPPDHLGEGLSMQFKGASIYKNKYYVVTNTEVLIYDLDTWVLENVISYPTFNDLHSILRTDDFLYVCNTGLEMIQVLNDDYKITEEINLDTVPTWDRFSKGIDYRRIATTKPHEIHVNHLFLLDGRFWATRGQKRDAVDIYQIQNRIDLKTKFSRDGIILCHDGNVNGAYVYFSTVDGHIIVVDKVNRQVIKDIEINKINDSGIRLGWVRGLESVGDYAFLGISKTRNSKFKEYSKWILQGTQRRMPSSIVQIDMRNNKIIDSYKMENYHGHAIYTILKYPS